MNRKPIVIRYFLMRAIVCVGVVAVFGCTPQTVATPRATHALSAPTLEASPTVRILSSEDLYVNETPSGVTEPTAASLPSGQYSPPIDLGNAENGVQAFELTLSNGALVQGRLYVPIALERSPIVVILGVNQDNWQAFAERLQAENFVVAVMTLPILTYTAEDFASILNTLSQVGDPSRMGVMGEIELADVALMGCASNPQCDSLALLSPINRDLALQAISTFQPRPLLLASAQDDPSSYPTALALSGVTQGTSTFLEYTTGRGVGLLTLNSDLEAQLLNWLVTTLP